PSLPSCAVLFPFFPLTCPPPTEISTLSLHDALPISVGARAVGHGGHHVVVLDGRQHAEPLVGAIERDLVQLHRIRSEPDGPDRSDRKSTRLNSSHSQISYAVFCLKKKRTPMSSYRMW